MRHAGHPPDWLRQEVWTHSSYIGKLLMRHALGEFMLEAAAVSNDGWIGTSTFASYTSLPN